MRPSGVASLAFSLLIAEKAVAESIAACGQTVQYDIVAPAPELRADMRAFSGVWVGDWANQLCGVLIVESVEKDGTVQTKYVNGTNPGWGIRRPGTYLQRHGLAADRRLS